MKSFSAHFLAPAVAAMVLAGCAGVLPVLPAGVVLPGATSTTAVSSPGLHATTNAVSVQTGDEQPLITLLQGPDGQIPTQGIVWTSSDDSVARVNTTTGQVKGIKSGTAVVTATLQADPNVRTTFTITVRESLTVVLIKITPNTPTMQIGDKLPLTAEVHLADGSINGNVSWSSSDDTIATVNPTTGEVTALREGRVTIAGAYAADSKYRGIADIAIVKDKSQLPPQVSATPVVFGPNATPIPTPPQTALSSTPKPAPRPSQITISTKGAQLVVNGYTPISATDDHDNRLDNGDGVVQRGESMYIRPTIENVGDTSTDHVSIKLGMDDPNGTLAFKDFGEGASGSVYLDSVPKGSNQTSIWVISETGDVEVAIEQGYLLEVSKSCPHGYVFTINATMSDRYGNEWTSSFQVPIP